MSFTLALHPLFHCCYGFKVYLVVYNTYDCACVCFYFVLSSSSVRLALPQLLWPDQQLANSDCPLIKLLYHRAHRVQGGLSKTKLMSLLTPSIPARSNATAVEWLNLASQPLKRVFVRVKCHRQLDNGLNKERELMCLAVNHAALHLGFLGWARCPLLYKKEKNIVFGILLLTDTNTTYSHFLAKSSVQSSTKLLNKRTYCHLVFAVGVFRF